MRIRKHYAKLLLGTGRINYSPPPSPPPFDQYQHFLAHAGGGAPCQLNCSPWDVLDFQNEEEEEEEEEDYYGFEAGDETEDKAVTTSSVVDKCGDADRKKAKNKKRERSRKERKAKVKVVEESTSTAIVVAEVARRCSKNNGKGWNCNRPSLPQQTLCDYHFYRLKKSKKKDNSSHDIIDMETDPPPIYSENNEHSILSRLRERKPKKEY